MALLCIGGPWHGQLSALIEPLDYFTVPINEEVTAASSYPPHLPLTFNEFTYKKQILRNGRTGGSCAIYCPADMNEAELIGLWDKHDRLINSYFKKEAAIKELDAANAKIDRLTSRGIEDMKFELDAFMAHVNEMYEVMDALKPYNVMQRTMVMELKSKSPAQSLATIQAQAVTDLISGLAYSTQVNGIATSIIDVDSAIKYADRLGEGNEV